MRNKLFLLLVIAFVAVAGFPVEAAVSGANHKDLFWTTAEAAKSTNSWTAQANRYGLAGPSNRDTIKCLNAEEVYFFIQVTGNCDATSAVYAAVERVLEPPTADQGGGRISSGTKGWPLASGWSQEAEGTTQTITAAGTYIIRYKVDAPYCRLKLTKLQDDDGDNTIQARYAIRARATNRPGGPD